MQETKLPKHPLLRWVLISYTKIALIPSILYLCLHIDKLMNVIQYTTHKIDLSLTNQNQEQKINQPQIFDHVNGQMTNIIHYISLGVAILAFMYASSFTMALIYHKTKLDTEYRILNSYNIEAYKEDVNKLTPTLFVILLVLSVMYSKM